MRPFFMEKLRRKYHLCQKLKLDQKNYQTSLKTLRRKASASLSRNLEAGLSTQRSN